MQQISFIRRGLRIHRQRSLFAVTDFPNSVDYRQPTTQHHQTRRTWHEGAASDTERTREAKKVENSFLQIKNFLHKTNPLQRDTLRLCSHTMKYTERICSLLPALVKTIVAIFEPKQLKCFLLYVFLLRFFFFFFHFSLPVFQVHCITISLFGILALFLGFFSCNSCLVRFSYIVFFSFFVFRYMCTNVE